MGLSKISKGTGHHIPLVSGFEMIPLIARLLIWTIFGCILYETILEANKLFSLSLNPWLSVLPILFLFLWQEYALRQQAKPGEPLSSSESEDEKNRFWYLVLSWFMVIILILFAFVIWMCTLYKQIVDRV